MSRNTTTWTARTPGMPARMNRFRFIDAPPDPPAAPVEPRTFTQDDLTAIATREREQGKRAGETAAQEAINAAIKAAGLDGDLTAILDAAKRATAADEAAKTEAQRDAEAAAKIKAEAEQLLATAAKTLHDTKVTQALAGAVDPVIAARALDVPVGADDATIKAAVDQLKAKVPGLFGGTPFGSGDPGKQPTTPTPGGTSAREAAKAAVEARFGKRT